MSNLDNFTPDRNDVLGIIPVSGRHLHVKKIARKVDPFRSSERQNRAASCLLCYLPCCGSRIRTKNEPAVPQFKICLQNERRRRGYSAKIRQSLLFLNWSLLLLYRTSWGGPRWLPQIAITSQGGDALRRDEKLSAVQDHDHLHQKLLHQKWSRHSWSLLWVQAQQWSKKSSLVWLVGKIKCRELSLQTNNYLPHNFLHLGEHLKTHSGEKSHKCNHCKR